MSRLPDEKIAAARRLRAKGHSIREVGALAGIKGIGSIHTYTKGIQLPFGPLKRGPKPRVAFNACRELKAQGLSIRAIAKRIGCGPTAVHRTFKTGRSGA
jgi:DNA invertase Pin-like site-specific DNA recombinase